MTLKLRVYHLPFDQPLQFAAILVDGNFKEVERINLRCRLSRHYPIPSCDAGNWPQARTIN